MSIRRNPSNPMKKPLFSDKRIITWWFCAVNIYVFVSDRRPLNERAAVSAMELLGRIDEYQNIENIV